MSEFVKAWTPSWAARDLPIGVDLIRVNDRWWLMLWNEQHAIAHPDPERWAYSNGELGDSVELELWIPPNRVTADLVRDLAEDGGTSSQEDITDETIPRK